MDWLVGFLVEFLVEFLFEHLVEYLVESYNHDFSVFELFAKSSFYL